MPNLPPDTLHFHSSSRLVIDPYLPPLSDETNRREQQQEQHNAPSRPFTTLTFATSLDSALSLEPGVRTTLSGPHSKAMTHYLRFRHEAILIGVGTANADDPGLNCRIEGANGYTEADPSTSSPPPPDPVIQALAHEAASSPELKELMKAVGASNSTPAQQDLFQSHIDRIKAKHAAEHAAKIRLQQDSLHQPRPIVVDPQARWTLHEGSKIMQLVKQGKGKAPFVLVSSTTSPPDSARTLLEMYGGKYIALETVDDQQHFDWNTILTMLYTQENIASVMIEGGGSIINSLLSEQRYSALIDSVIVTIAPTWLGQGGVVVSPNRRVDNSGCPIPASRLTDVKWSPFGEDVVLCGRIMR